MYTHNLKTFWDLITKNDFNDGVEKNECSHSSEHLWHGSKSYVIR